MANAAVAVMGPPPSPKEPRRSGRRSVPSASTSKSPAGSPTSDTAPKVKENPQRPPMPSSSSSNKSKRSKQEDQGEVLEEIRRNGVNGGGNTRTKRKGKEKEKASVNAEAPSRDGEEDVPRNDAEGEDAAVDPEEDDEEAGITRCICADEEPEAAGEFMAQCEECKAWQHGQCMGFANIAALPQHYYCELCRPDLYVELLKKYARRTRQPSTHSHHTATGTRHASRSSRSRSPVHPPKQTKRRNTMNSRDAAYEESFQALIEATAAEAAAAAQETKPTSPISGSLSGDISGHVEGELEAEVVPNSRRKRKRSDDDISASKRTRSASIASDRTAVAHTIIGRDATPINSSNSVTKSIPVSMPSAKISSSRNRRTAARKVQDLVPADGDEGAASTRRQATNRAKANTAHETNNRKGQGNAASSQAASSTAAPSIARAYHNSHAYAVSQQPLFTSWNLPDYLAHLEPMLPTDIPQPLEVRGCGIDSAGRESLERTTERGVKVKWPSKRMSVGDMNKRVRALVEWVGREQASALERTRRREALEKVMHDAQDVSSHEETASHPASEAKVGVTVEGTAAAYSPLQQKILNGTDDPPSKPPNSGAPDPAPTTMRMMEELMEELISFQERFGPGAKTKDRDRRAAVG